MATPPYGNVLAGDETVIQQSFDTCAALPVDRDVTAEIEAGTWPASQPVAPIQTTLGDCFSVTGPGTFRGKAQRTLTFEPTRRQGWWFDRTDLPEQMPIGVSVNNVWTTARNIVLASGSPHNYMRMVEHIVALKVGMRLDNVMVRMASGDPPLFDRGSMDLVEGVERVGIIPQTKPRTMLTVKEPVCIGGPHGSFLAFYPAESGSHALVLDCAVDFASAIGVQRIRFPVNAETFRHGALARTNTTSGMMLYCKTIGKLFADTRNLGYTTSNILVAGKKEYVNKPGLLHNGKSMEAVWHRATLDLLAAIALIDIGQLAGTIISYKAGHTLDVRMIQKLYQQELLEEMA